MCPGREACLDAMHGAPSLASVPPCKVRVQGHGAQGALWQPNDAHHTVEPAICVIGQVLLGRNLQTEGVRPMLYSSMWRHAGKVCCMSSSGALLAAFPTWIATCTGGIWPLLSFRSRSSQYIRYEAGAGNSDMEAEHGLCILDGDGVCSSRPGRSRLT